MAWYEFAKWLHILSATLLFGTGLGSAFYKWCADRGGNIQAIAHTNKMVVIADWIFTTPTVIIQPVTGLWLVSIMGFSLTEPWILLAFALYTVAGVCWLPVVWLQIRMRDLANLAVENNRDLDEIYSRYARWWFWLGVPAFVSMVLVYFLMVFKPTVYV